MTAPAAAVEAASLRLGTFALHELDLALGEGEIFVLLGPNGAGKSVTLEMIAGFHRPQGGRILIGGRDVTPLPPERRRIGLMVQDFGLFPHLTVARNVGFARPEADVGALLGRFGITHLADRMPGGLSAGERQRTALARALAVKPELFLFDEPFSALDARSRAALRDDLKSFLRAEGAAAIFVTHDPDEACVLADRAAVMRGGAIVQTGSTETLFRRPADRWIAEFVGVETIVPGVIINRAAGLWRIAVSGATLLSTTPIDAAELLVCIRADEVELRREVDAAATRNSLPGRVAAIANRGTCVLATVDCGFPLSALLTSRQARHLELSQGQPVVAVIDPEAVHLLPLGAGVSLAGWSGVGEHLKPTMTASSGSHQGAMPGRGPRRAVDG